MQCRFCKKATATVHVTWIVENETTKADFCEACAKEKGVNDPATFPLPKDVGRPKGDDA
ncbi:MAG TPA: hypothetical protein PLX89_00625 [Verrucomicrobiota bacterium]|nr:hypothetical protein [Verrucomicrobiota bacterium]